MKYEKSCGAIIFYRNRRNTKILLVKNNNGRYWSFPKGHIEQGENEEETAIREIKEETGLELTNIIDLEWTFQYESLGDSCIEHAFISYTDVDDVKLNEENIAYK